MTSGSKAKSQGAKHPPIVKPIDAAAFAEETREMFDMIARRAYELFESRGRHDGNDLEDWLRAESELFEAIPVHVQETEQQFIVRADMAGLHQEDIELRVGPRRVIISGKQEQICDTSKRNLTHTERNFTEVLRVLEFPKEVDSDHVSAAVRGQSLEIRLPKVPSSPNAA